MTKPFYASIGLLTLAVAAFLLYELACSTDVTLAEEPVLGQVESAPPRFAGSDSRSINSKQPPSSIGAAALDALDFGVELPEEVSLESLPDLIHATVGIPVLIDSRSLKISEASLETRIQFGRGERPLRSALRQGLEPLGLRATVDDDGILIVADPAVLVRRGIGISRWINVDAEAERAIAAKLADKVSYDFREETLENALRIIAEDIGLQILLDHKALEDTPYTRETPVSLSLSNVSLRTFLQMMLRDLVLVYTIESEILVVTTPELAEQAPLSRIYWLEGTGLTDGGGIALIKAIEYTIEPNAWYNVGGDSIIKVITGVRGDRPAILISAPYMIHYEVERLLAIARESHFGPDPPFDPDPATGYMSGYYLGGVGGGMGTTPPGDGARRIRKVGVLRGN